MRVKRYVKAADVLPRELLHQVSEALGGTEAYVWIPAARNINRCERNRYVLDLRRRGFSVREIAIRLFMNERTVWRVLARLREAVGLPSRASDKEGHQ
jgi:DNA-binding NarL/FixJ family response regulator